MAAINSFASTGFGTNILNPAESARVRSSTRTFAVKATAGNLFPFVASSILIRSMSEYPSSPGIAEIGDQHVGLIPLKNFECLSHRAGRLHIGPTL